MSTQNKGCLGIFLDLICKPKPPVVPNYAGGFSIDQLFDKEDMGKKFDVDNPPKSLLYYLRHNANSVELNDGRGELVTAGWFLNINRKQKAGEDVVDFEKTKYEKLGLSSIEQIVLHIDNYSGTPRIVKVYKLEADHLLTSDIKDLEKYVQTIRPSYTQYKIVPDKNRPFFNVVNAIGNDEQYLRNKDFEFYQPYTALVFFSTSQLTLLLSQLESAYTSGKKARTIFSGFDMRIGRVASESSMNELESLKGEITVSDFDPAHWFSLKAELITSEITGFGASAVRMMAGEDNSEVSSEDGSLPSIHFGQPCPPKWEMSDFTDP